MVRGVKQQGKGGTANMKSYQDFISEEDKKKPKKKEKKLSLADRVEKLESKGKKKAGEKKKPKPTPLFGDNFNPDD